MNQEYIATSMDQLKKIASDIVLANYPDQKVFLLIGDLGSGKTSFVKACGEVLGFSENISSPTFSIVHEYRYSGHILFHFDLYRVKNEQELYEIGFEEYLEQDAYVFIEWPELALNFVQKPYITLQFEQINMNTRRIICSIVN